MRPAQCSSLRRSFRPGGCPPDLTSASEGADIFAYRFRQGTLVQTEVLQDGVPARPCRRSVRHRFGELLRRQTDVLGCLGQTMTVEARDDLAEALGALAQMRRAQVVTERRAEAGQLAVVGGAREERVDGVQDLVVAAARRP